MTALARLFTEVLGVEAVGPEEDFFALGGDSLKALMLLIGIDYALGVRLTVAEFMDRSTVAGLAEQVERRKSGDSPSRVSEPDTSAEPVAFERLLRVVRTWEGSRHKPDGLLVGRHPEGTRPALFWCLQGEAEFASLAEHLGPEVPLFAMRSGNQILADMAETIPAVALRYATEILEIRPAGPHFLGGNCQGGGIAFEVAQELLRRGHHVERLLLLETFIESPYPGAVNLIYGRESTLFNPYYEGPSPDPVFEESYGSYTVDFIPGDHGQFFRSPNIEELAATLRRRMKEAEVEVEQLPAG